jgi:hypothetical protein
MEKKHLKKKSGPKLPRFTVLLLTNGGWWYKK